MCRPLGYKRVYLALRKVKDTPFHIQGDDIWDIWKVPPPINSRTIYLQFDIFHFIIFFSLSLLKKTNFRSLGGGNCGILKKI